MTGRGGDDRTRQRRQDAAATTGRSGEDRTARSDDRTAHSDDRTARSDDRTARSDDRTARSDDRTVLDLLTVQTSYRAPFVAGCV